MLSATNPTMKLNLIISCRTASCNSSFTIIRNCNSIPFLRNSTPLSNHNHSLSLLVHFCKQSSRSSLPLLCFSNPITQSNSNEPSSDSNSTVTELLVGGTRNSTNEETNLNVHIRSPVVPPFLQASNKLQLSLNDQAFFLLSFIACTTSIAFTSLVVAAIPTLNAMGRAATSLSKLADTAREELPSTMTAIRLSGMEISDLTLELSDLSHEVTDGVNKSAQAVQAAEAGIRQIGKLAHQHTISMIQERADLPIISLQPVVAGAAKKTSQAVGQATKSFMRMISLGDFSSENKDDDGLERVDI